MMYGLFFVILSAAACVSMYLLLFKQEKRKVPTHLDLLNIGDIVEPYGMTLKRYHWEVVGFKFNTQGKRIKVVVKHSKTGDTVEAEKVKR